MKTKNLFFSMLAMTGMLFTASCTQEDVVNAPAEGDFVDATFTLSTADGLATRATIGDGTTVDKVACAVYDAAGKEMTDLYKVVDITDKTATYSVRLGKGQNYRVAFFAYNEAADAYDVTDLKNVVVKGGQFSNAEGRDAFTAYNDVTTGETMNPVDKKVTLRRPFAQLNLGIDNTELEDARKAGIVVEQTKIKVSNVYDVFSAYDDAVVTTDAAEEMVFDLADLPAQKLVVDDKEYNYLAMNYLLVGDKGTEKSLTDVEFIWTGAENKTNDPTTSFINIPVQRNYRTNILGKLLTNPANFTIVIDEKFDGDKNKIYQDENGVYVAVVSTPEDLQEAINEAKEEGDYLIRLEDFFAAPALTRAADFNGEIWVAQHPGVNLVIDGCGATFDGSINIHSGSNHYRNASLAIRNVNFETAQVFYDSNNTPYFYFINAADHGTENGISRRYSCNVTIDNCTFTTLNNEVHNYGVGVFAKSSKNFKVVNCTATGMHSLIQAQSCDEDVFVDNATITGGKNGVAFKQVRNAVVSNSTIEGAAYGIRFDGNTDNYSLLVKDCKVAANQPLIVRKMTGANNTIKLEGNNVFTTDALYQIVITKDSDDKPYSVPTGTYTLTGAEGYNVYPTVVEVATAEQLQNAFAYATVINLTDNIDLAGTDWTPVGTSEAGFSGMLNGNNKSISNLKVADTDYAALIAYAEAGAIIKNLTLENVDINSTKHAAGVVCVAGEGLTVENVKVSGTITAVSYAGGLVHNVGNGVVIKDCENNATVSASRAGGIASWATIGATFVNVKNTGDITGAIGASGIVHGFAGSIKNAINTGNISSANVEAAAGIAGVQKGASTYEYCFNYGNVTSTYDNVNASAAGILGQTPGSASTLKYCANYGDITAVKSYAAGIAYSLYGQVNASYCYNAGSVFGEDGAGAIAPKAAYGAGDKASYCLNAGAISSTKGSVYQGSNNNVSSYYYDGETLKNVANNTEVAQNDALNLLNGGTDKTFFSVSDGKIAVVK